MNTISTSILAFVSALIMFTLWYMFFIMEIPYVTIGDASGEFWYQHSYWGLLLTSSISMVLSITSLAIGYRAYRKGVEVASSVKSNYTRLILLSVLGVIYAFYILANFIYVSCAC